MFSQRNSHLRTESLKDLSFKNLPQHRQTRLHAVRIRVHTHQTDAPDFSFERAEAGADFRVVIAQECLTNGEFNDSSVN